MRKVILVNVKIFAQFVHRIDGGVVLVEILFNFRIRFAAFDGARRVLGQAQNVRDDNV